MSTICYGVGGVSLTNPDDVIIVCSHIHDTLQDARQCYAEMSDTVKAVTAAWEKNTKRKTCIVKVEISTHPLTDA